MFAAPPPPPPPVGLSATRVKEEPFFVFDIVDADMEVERDGCLRSSGVLSRCSVMDCCAVVGMVVGGLGWGWRWGWSEADFVFYRMVAKKKNGTRMREHSFFYQI